MKFVLKVILWIVLLLFSVAVIFMALNWVPDRSVDDLKARWAPPPSQFIEVAGMQVHLRDEGPRDDSMPLVLLHGTSASLHTWDGWVEDLKRERRVIRFDLPGFGLTGPSIDHNYTTESFAKITVAILNYLAVDQVVMVGNSLGGNVAWTTALLYPDRIGKLVLIDSSGFEFKPKSVPIGFKIARIPVLNQLMAKVLPRDMVRKSVENVYGNPLLVTDELVDRYFELTTRAGNRRSLIKRLSQLSPGKYVHRLSEIKQPTLIMWGSLDQLIPIEIGEQFHQAISNSQLIRFNELGHVPQEENPQATVTVLKRFLRSTD